METATTVTVHDAELHVAQVGTAGPAARATAPLLLLHGLTGTSGDWAHVFDLAALAETRRVVIPDARGHGRSKNLGDAFGFRVCALDALAILDALGIDRVQAIGASLGAKTLLHLATLAPERISAMVLVSAAPRLPEPTRALFRAAAAAPRSADEREAMRRAHPQGDAQIEALWALPARLAADTPDLAFTPERLRAITARTLLVSGDRDPLYPVELAVELLRGIPDASLYVVPGGGHLPIFGPERAPFVARALASLAGGAHATGA